ncbi:hypothetical protein [Heyndrickxia acidicola]|uniref:Uncharacterized protein n=1 Tax=Heyndrickxia acidicola TaxID=209389 RepID=A0ABU6MHG5_9BACI|nr:hypothetical protein [Heyndrickxia acidicola]MED1203945.1 hypothetical protein [Heyndrickxia acidicola]
MNKFSPSFFIGSISIGTVEGASCVNFGNNLPSGFTNYKKHSQGFGTVSGDNADVHDLLARLEQQDTKDLFRYDSNVEENSHEINEMLKELILNDDVSIEDEDDEQNEPIDINIE